MTVTSSSNLTDPLGQKANTPLFNNLNLDQVTGGANPNVEQAATKSADPVDKVDLSYEAKLALEKLKADKAAADILITALLDHQETESEATNSSTKELAAELFGTANSSPDDAVEQPSSVATTSPLSQALPAPEGFDALSELNSIAAGGFKDFDKILEQSRNHQSSTTSFSTHGELFESLATVSLVLKHRALEISGKTEQAQQLRDAAVGGTLKFEDPSKVDGLNLTYDKIVTESPGGGRGVHYELNQNPVGDVKDALDSGQAFTLGQGDYGAFYVTIGQADTTA